MKSPQDTQHSHILLPMYKVWPFSLRHCGIKVPSIKWLSHWRSTPLASVSICAATYIHTTVCNAKGTHQITEHQITTRFRQTATEKAIQRTEERGIYLSHLFILLSKAPIRNSPSLIPLGRSLWYLPDVLRLAHRDLVSSLQVCPHSWISSTKTLVYHSCYLWRGRKKRGMDQTSLESLN